MIFPPFLLFFVFIFFFILVFLFGFIHWGIISYAFARIGIPPDQMFSLLFLCLLGSFVNIPIKKIPNTKPQVVWEQVAGFWGMRYYIPRLHQDYTVIAVNVGGAIIPSLISLYLLMRWDHLLAVMIGVAVVSLITHKFSKPIPGVGITVPLFIPPLVAAICALILTPNTAPATAYISGSLGTLIGADLLNLNKIKDLNAPVASIGGAGTFDGIFMTGILAVLLA